MFSPEQYLVSVRDRGRTPRQWQQRAYDILRCQLSGD
jgi:hypothetical protein